MTPQPPAEAPLAESEQVVFRRIAALLRSRFSGEILLTVDRGAVSRVREVRDSRPSELAASHTHEVQA